MDLTPIPQNYKNNVNWVLGAYTDAGVSFPNGFQKDSIQNSVGARKSKKWKDWHCDISVVINDKGTFVIVEDSGTYGLTGKNISSDEINRLIAEGQTLPASERLSRFTSMFNSGGNTGPGLYGAGKSVYSVASDDYLYYFDSLRDDGKYVANINDCGQVMPTALEGESAKQFILQSTGLTEKQTTGTRVIIASPKKELSDAITDGSIIPYIQESWWRIIQRLPEGAGISVNGNMISVPENYKAATNKYELPASGEIYSPGYKVKNFGLYVFEDGKNTWSGISYYRLGMKIGEIDIKDVPKKIDGKFWGYVEVEGEWETDLSEIEDKVHFGVSKGKKHTTTYQYLKNYCNEKFQACMLDWGYVKDKENEDKKLRDELHQIAEDIQDLFDKLGFEDLGKGPQKSDFDVRWQDVHYPDENSERVTSNDHIKFSMRLKSAYRTEKKFEYKLTVVNPKNGDVVSQFDTGSISVKAGSVIKKDFDFIVTKSNSEQFAENRIILTVKVTGSGKEKRKELPYFYDIDKPDNTTETVKVTLHSYDPPVEGSRRVNFDESVRNVSYLIENKRNHSLDYTLKVSVHNASDPTCPKIEDITSWTGTIAPFEETVTSVIDKICFEKTKYEQYMSSGVIELRARLIANADDEEFEKGDRITFYNFKFFLNCDEKNGKNDSFDVKSIDDPSDFRRSWNTPGNGRTIYLNVGHTAFLNMKDYPDLQHEYMREQMLKQYVLLYLAEGRYDMFGEQGKTFTDLEPQEAADQVLKKIESIYYQSLR